MKRGAVFSRFRDFLAVLAAWGWCTAAGAGLYMTPEMDLELARHHYERGTNYMAQGRFEDAREVLETAARRALDRDMEIERRAETFGVLREQFEIVLKARTRFEEDWTGAATAAKAIGKPLRCVLDIAALGCRHSEGLCLMHEQLSETLALLDKLSGHAAAGRRQAARDALAQIQNDLERQLAAFVALLGCCDEFNDLLARIAGARAQLLAAEAGPMDADQALERVRSLRERAEMSLGGESWAGAISLLDFARSILDDLRQNDLGSVEANELAASVAETERQYWLCGARHLVGDARRFARAGNPYARRMLETARRVYFPKLASAGGPDYEELLREAGELEAVAAGLRWEVP